LNAKGRHHGSIIKVSKIKPSADWFARTNVNIASPTGQLSPSETTRAILVPRRPIHWIDQGEFPGVADLAEKLGDDEKTTPTTAQRQNGRTKNLDPLKGIVLPAWLPEQVDNPMAARSGHQ
jgi:hypothetical protein